MSLTKRHSGLISIKKPSSHWQNAGAGSMLHHTAGRVAAMTECYPDVTCEKILIIRATDMKTHLSEALTN